MSPTPDGRRSPVRRRRSHGSGPRALRRGDRSRHTRRMTQFDDRGESASTGRTASFVARRYEGIRRSCRCRISAAERLKSLRGKYIVVLEPAARRGPVAFESPRRCTPRSMSLWCASLGCRFSSNGLRPIGQGGVRAINDTVVREAGLRVTTWTGRKRAAGRAGAPRGTFPPRA